MREVTLPLYVLISGGLLTLATGIALGVLIKEYLDPTPPGDAPGHEHEHHDAGFGMGPWGP